MGAHGGAARALRDGALHARAGLRGLRTRCGAGRSTTSRASGRRSGTSSASAASYERVLGRRVDARRGLVPGRAAQLRRAGCSAASDDDASRSCTPPSCAPLGRVDWGELRDADGARSAPACARSASAGATASAAYLPNIPETIAAFLATASLGAIWSSARAGVRRAQRDRPLRADRAEGAARDRRLPLRRQGLRPRARSSRHRARRSARRSCGSATSTARAGRTASSATRRARVRARAVRPPALGALLLGHDRPAEGDRAGPGRHPARAAQEAAPAPRRARRATACSGSPRPAG